MHLPLLLALASPVLQDTPVPTADYRPVASVPLGPGATTAWGDWDGDGLLDLYVAGRGAPDRLLGNQGDGTFVDLTSTLGLAPLEGARTTRFADYDGDGHVDLLRVSAEGTLVLERNVDGVGFEPAPLEGALRAGRIGLLAAEWIDYDRDGYLDLALLTLSGQELWHGRGGRAFEPIPLPRPTSARSSAGREFTPASARAMEREEHGATAAAAPSVSLGSVATGPGAAFPATALCLDTLRDQVTGSCLSASSVPMLGTLYPLGPELNIDALGRVGVGTIAPGERLDVAGTVRADGLRLPAGAQSGYVLTSDAVGNGTWQPDSTPVGVGGGGTTGYLARFTASSAVGDSLAFESAGRLGLGTSAPDSGVHVVLGPLDTVTGRTKSLRLEGKAVGGTGATLDFGPSSAGPRAHISQNPASELEIIADRGVVFGGGDNVGDGNVGIKTADLTHSLNVAATSESQALRLLGTQFLYAGARLSFGDGDWCMIEEQDDDELHIRSRLGVTIDRNSFENARTLTVLADGDGGSTNAAIYASNLDPGNSMALAAEAWGDGTAVQLNNRGTGSHLACSAGAGNVFEVKHSGRVVTTALEVTGGGDLVEGFEVAGAAPAPGTVMAIDPDHPGKLVPSAGPYDRRVAGAVSGAGGVAHGIRLGQRGVLEGEVLVAMAGRIYVRCTAATGSIEPGDRLTTSSAPGMAMKATDAERASGAVLGKAMSALAEGDGLVLVLIDLQ